MGQMVVTGTARITAMVPVITETARITAVVPVITETAQITAAVPVITAMAQITGMALTEETTEIQLHRLIHHLPNNNLTRHTTIQKKL